MLTPAKDWRYKRKSKQDYKTKPSLNYIPNKLTIIQDKEKTGIFKLFYQIQNIFNVCNISKGECFKHKG